MLIDSLPGILQRRYGIAMRVVAAVVLLMVAVPVVAVQPMLMGLGLSALVFMLVNAVALRSNAGQ